MKTLKIIPSLLLASLLLSFQPAGAFDCVTQTEIPQTECEALNALFINTSGATSWTNTTGWIPLLTTTLPCSAYGVACVNGNVQTLDLNTNQLNGTIPSQIGDLTNLEYLILNSNQLSGSIPPEIGLLTNLLYLFLHNNLLSGPIPTQIGALNNLTKLELQLNQLNGSIPAELWNLTNLEFLYLNNNNLEGSIPAAIGNLTKLLNLFLGDNKLKGPLPTEIGGLTELQYLKLRNNLLSGAIPFSLTKLTKLLPFDIPSGVGGLNIDNNYLYICNDPVLNAFVILKGGATWASTQHAHCPFAWSMFIPAITAKPFP